MANHTTGKHAVDLEIHILPGWDEDYPVKVILGGQQQFAGHLAASVLPWVPGGDLKEDGRRLFDTLFADSVLRRAWERALGQAEAQGAAQRRIRLHIDQDAAELHTLPWELLREGHAVSQMLSAREDTPFSRYLASDLPWRSPLKGRPIRVLVVIANPDDLEERYGLAPVDVAAERRVLQTVLEAVGADELQAEFLAAPATLERLGEKLFDDYHVLHFVGHGAFSARRGQAALYMQDQVGHARRVLDDALAELLADQGRQLRLVFLAACQSATRSMSDAFQGLGPKLVTAGVPAVIAMQDVVTIETASKFSRTFYRQLLQHYQVDLAVNEARRALLTAGRADAAVPVLFMRVQDGLLFGLPDEEEEPKPGVKVDLEAREGGQIVIQGDFQVSGGTSIKSQG